MPVLFDAVFDGFYFSDGFSFNGSGWWSLAETGNMLPARLQMAFTLGFHITLACFGVGLPVLMLLAEWRFLKTGDPLWRTLCKRWSKAFAVMFAVGAISGTVLSFELGLLWPGFMGRWGSVIGMPFTMEGFAFFLEAIFAGIYLYGWDRLSPRAHWYTGWPVALSGLMSAFFVVTANSWMNAPAGFRLEAGNLVDIDPMAAMFNVATGAQTAHMIVAAYLVTGFGVAAFYAFHQLRDPEPSGSQETNDPANIKKQPDIQTEYNRRAIALALFLALPLTPVQMVIGDWSAKVVAKSQPVKLAAMEGQFKTETRAPLRIGGIPNTKIRETKYALDLPGVLSWMAYGDIDAEVKGLDDFPADEVPPVLIVHLAFQVMVGIGTLMLAVAFWGGISYLKQRRWPNSKLFLYLLVSLGPLSVLALQAGWVVTEVGRQPWIVQGYMKTAEAVTQAPGVWPLFFATLAIYGIIGISTVIILRRLSRLPLEGVQSGTK